MNDIYYLSGENWIVVILKVCPSSCLKRSNVSDLNIFTNPDKVPTAKNYSFGDTTIFLGLPSFIVIVFKVLPLFIFLWIYIYKIFLFFKIL